MTPDYINSLIRTESGGNWAARNNAIGAGGKAGHFGRLQFGQARLLDAMRAGAIPVGTTPEQFMASPELQMAAERWHFADLERQLAPLVGSVVNGQKMDMAALVAMGHLGGAAGARRYVESGGRYNPSDVFGTSLSDYARTHGGAGGASMGGQTMQMSTQNAQPRGLLGQPQEEDLGLVGGLLSRLGMNVNRDRLDRLAMTFAALDGSPGMQPLIENIQARQSERRQDQQRNRTVEWLASQGRTDLAEAVAGGMLPAANAVQLALTPADPMAAINLERAQLELEALRNPQPEMPTPQSGIAKLEADRRAGLISDEQYQAALQAMAPQGTIIESDGQGGFRMVQGAGAASTRPMTEAQSKDTVFATRARGALETFEPVADALTSAIQRAANIDPTGIIRGAVQSPEFQVAQNSGNEFLQAILRKDTGAAITRDEQSLYGETYLPQPGDGPDVLAAKRDARARAVAALEAGMNAQQIEQMTRALQSQIRGGGSVAPAPAGQPQRLRFNPETGDFE